MGYTLRTQPRVEGLYEMEQWVATNWNRISEALQILEKREDYIQTVEERLIEMLDEGLHQLEKQAV